MNTATKTTNGCYEVHDINLAAYLHLKGESPTFSKRGTKVIFDFESSEKVFQLVDEFNSNPRVYLIDYVSALRTMRARMLAAR